MSDPLSFLSATLARLSNWQALVVAFSDSRDPQSIFKLIQDSRLVLVRTNRDCPEFSGEPQEDDFSLMAGYLESHQVGTGVPSGCPGPGWCSVETRVSHLPSLNSRQSAAFGCCVPVLL